MLLGIDHLVIAVEDPDRAAEGMERDLGLAVTGGGRHEHGGTFNRLAFVGDTYLELIGVFDRAMVESAAASAVGRAAMTLLDRGVEGLATYALASDDVASDVARLRAAGSTIGAAVAGSRTRADGEVVQWISAFPDLGPEEPPFLIEHEPAGAEWGPAARLERAAFRHPGGGAVRLTGLSIPVERPKTVGARYRATVGIDVGADGRATVRGQSIAIASRETLPEPVVTLTGDPGTAPLDLVRFGVRWRRTPA